MKPYVIISPPWETTSGGVRVMFGLYGWLLAKGQVAFMNQKPTTGDFIVIYPEIQQGNPVGGSTVVRYILNKPGVVPALMSDGTLRYGPTEFDPTDKLIYFSRLYGGDDTNTMFLPILDLNTFKDYGWERKKTCWLLGKGMNYQRQYIHPSDSIELDRKFATDQKALAELLNRCSVLYCYDPNTAMTEVARLCGTRVVMINPLYSKEQFSLYEPGLQGISWGKDEEVPLDSKAFREHYIGMRKLFEARLDQFIEETQ